MAADTKELTIVTVDFDNPEEMARFREQEEAVFRQRKEKIIAQLHEEGHLDAQNNWHFKEPYPEDMLPDAKTDFNH